MFSLITGILIATASVSPITPLTALAIEESGELPKAELTQTELITNKINEVFGKDAPIMLEVARCESGIRQFDENGKVVKNPVTPDYGVFQLNLPSHQKELEKLELDHLKAEDNIKYAKHLFDKNGLKDWYMSKKCWDK